MTRILILANDNATIFYFRRELLEKLINEKYEVVISVPQSDKNIALENLGCQVDEIILHKTGKNPLQDLFLYRSYIRQIKKIKPDLVLTYTAKPNIYGSLACQKLNVPYINNVTGLGSIFQTDNLIKKIMLLLQKRAYKKSRCVFFQNASNKKYFEDRNIVSSNSALIPGSGVNLQKYKYVSYPEDDEKVKFVISSRIRKDKGFDELLEAVHLVYKENKKVEFYLAGFFDDKCYEEQINEMSQQYPLHFLGLLDQTENHQLMAKSHCLIHPSHHEGMANVVLEAASTGRPCIVSNIPGCREAVEGDLTGFLFEVKNSNSLAMAIIKFINLSLEAKAKMGLAARKKIEKEFDRNIVVDAYLRKMKDVLSIN